MAEDSAYASKRADWAFWGALTWVLFTSSLVCWWWIHSLQQLYLLQQAVPADKLLASKRMLFWEGSFLVLAVVLGGVALVYLIAREKKRNEQMRLFFSHFAHDLKTAMTRMRLQCEVLDEKSESDDLRSLMQSMGRLDLQLENSLWLAREEKQPFLKEPIKLSDIVSSLRLDCPELEFQITKEARLLADSSALRSVLRNLVNNSVVHGEATRMEIQVENVSPEKVRIHLQDNGRGYTGFIDKLGKELLQPKSSHGNGLGLYLSRKMIERMGGNMKVVPSQKGFHLWIELPGGNL